MKIHYYLQRTEDSLEAYKAAIQRDGMGQAADFVDFCRQDQIGIFIIHIGNFDVNFLSMVVDA